MRQVYDALQWVQYDEPNQEARQDWRDYHQRSTLPRECQHQPTEGVHEDDAPEDHQLPLRRLDE